MLDEREHAFETKFAHDQDIRFRVHAWRNRLIGLWAAQKLHLRPAEAEAYATALTQVGVGKFGDEGLVRKLMSDFLTNGEAVSESEIRDELERLLPVAKQHVATCDRSPG